jgi:spore coat protein U-like protein
MRHVVRRFLLILFLSVQVSCFFAATQGTVGDTSSGTSNVQITIEAVVRISQVSDILLDVPANQIGQDMQQTDTVCIYSNHVNQEYKITAVSARATPEGEFKLVNDSAGQFMLYEVYWSGGGSTQQLLNNDPTLFSGASNHPDCLGSGDNASFTVKISGSQTKEARAGTYLDTLTLMITPPV